MKKVLLASSALALTAGAAAADVTVSGDGRMGIIQGFDQVISYFDEDTNSTVTETVKGKFGFTSRIRISFSASGETDAGLSFGGTIRADTAGGFNLTDALGRSPGDTGFGTGPGGAISVTAGGGVAGQDGNVFIEGAFGKLSMGGVDGAARTAVGHISGVGLTGLNDLNEVLYVANIGGEEPGLLYEYTTGAFGVYASVSNPRSTFTGGSVDLQGDKVDLAYAIAGDYSWTNWNFALGYERNDALDINHIIGGITGSTGGFTGKFIFGSASGSGADGLSDKQQWGLSGDYTTGATTLTAYYKDGFNKRNNAFGIGVAYDLGGGASVKAGFATREDGVNNLNDQAWDIGLNFSF